MNKYSLKHGLNTLKVEGVMDDRREAGEQSEEIAGIMQSGFIGMVDEFDDDDLISELMEGGGGTMVVGGGELGGFAVTEIDALPDVPDGTPVHATRAEASSDVKSSESLSSVLENASNVDSVDITFDTEGIRDYDSFA
jgi:hypothetical protein